MEVQEGTTIPPYTPGMPRRPRTKKKRIIKKFWTKLAKHLGQGS